MLISIETVISVNLYEIMRETNVNSVCVFTNTVVIVHINAYFKLIARLAANVIAITINCNLGGKLVAMM